MAWNKDKIISNLENLKKEINNSNNDNTKLLYDYNIYLALLKIIDTNLYKKYSIYTIDDINLEKYYEDFVDESINTILTNRSFFYKASIIIEDLKYIIPKLIYKKNIPIYDYYILLNEYLNNNPNLLNIYNELKDNNMFLSLKKSSISLLKGASFETSLNKDKYIYVSKFNSINVSTLVHELAHIEEFNIINDFESKIKYQFSSFTEVYPNFSSQVFCHSNNDSKYRNVFLNDEVSIFHNMKEISNVIDVSLDKLNKKDNCYLVYKDNIDTLLSSIFTLYLYNLYRNDKNKYNEIINYYHSILGKSDTLIWDIIKEIDIKKVLNEEEEHYNNGLVLGKKR